MLRSSAPPETEAPRIPRVAKVCVFVRSPACTARLAIMIDPCATVQALMEACYDEVGVPTHLQRLSHNSKELMVQARLCDSGVGDGSFVHDRGPRCRGGGSTPPSSPSPSYTLRGSASSQASVGHTGQSTRHSTSAAMPTSNKSALRSGTKHNGLAPPARRASRRRADSPTSSLGSDSDNDSTFEPHPRGRVRSGSPRDHERQLEESDFQGAIDIVAIAQEMIDLPVAAVFGGICFSGKVVSFEAFPEFGGRILHVVEYSDGDCEEVTYARALAMHDHFRSQTRHPASGQEALAPPTLIDGTPHTAAAEPQAPPQQVHVGVTPFPIPASLASRPVFVRRDDEIIEGRIVAHTANATGEDTWTVSFKPRHPDVNDATYSTFEFQNMISQSCRGGVSSPACAVPTVSPTQLVGDTLCCIDDVNWTLHHGAVDRLVVAHQHDTLMAWEEEKRRAAEAGSKRKPVKPLHKFRIVAASCSAAVGATTTFLGRRTDNPALFALFTNAQELAEGMHAYEFPSRTLRTSLAAQTPVPAPPTPEQPTGADTALGGPVFAARLESLAATLPDAASPFFEGGFRIIRKRVPRRAMRNYREGLLFVHRQLDKDPQSVVLNKLALLYDALVLGPVEKPDTIHTAIRRRVTLLRSGDWSPLLQGLCPLASGKSTVRPPTHADPSVARAARAERILAQTSSKSGAASALRAPLRPPAQAPGAHTAALRKLNPTAGSALNRVGPTGEADTRRPLRPPTEPPPPPI